MIKTQQITVMTSSEIKMKIEPIRSNQYILPRGHRAPSTIQKSGKHSPLRPRPPKKDRPLNRPKTLPIVLDPCNPNVRFIDRTKRDSRRGENGGEEGDVTHVHESVELGGLDHFAEAERVLADGGFAGLARGPPGLRVLRPPGLRRRGRRHSAGCCR
jgi:hypothetical protein